MKMLKLHNGAELPALGLGTWLSDKGLVRKAVRHALEVGYRHIDGAFIYGNEAEVGAGVKDAIADGICSREDVWVTTKLWNDMHDPGDVREGLETSLKNLGLDYVDLYLVHWPVAHKKGVLRPREPSDFLSLEQMPIEKTWAGMAELPGTGLCKQVGVSNFNAQHIERVSEAVGLVPVVNQIELHPYLAQNELLAAMQKRGVVATAYSPLGSSGRPDSMRRDDEVRLLDDPAVAQIAEELSATPAQVIIAWALARGTSVIPKSTTPGRIEENWGAAALELSDAHRQRLDALDRHDRYVTGEFWCPPGSPYTLESLWGER